MRYWGAGGARRWRLAIAVVATLGVFAAVVTGWAARGSAVPGVALPQLAAQSQETHAAQPAEHAATADLHNDAHPGTPAPALVGRDLLTHLCVARVDRKSVV